LGISTWKQSQPQNKQQEANRKQKALDILASARRIGFEINHRYCLTTEQPILFAKQPILFAKQPILFADIVCQTPNLFDGCHRLPLPRKVYIAGHLGLISLSPLMYYFTFMQATLIHFHNKTRSALVTHHYYCLGTSSNQPWWI
jgi:hypothetical protein